MENQNQRNRNSSGHEGQGVHICHKCGWQFPNPHPSARHRRAHKRICGTIQGYKLENSEEKKNHVEGSDDEHPDEDEQKTPIPSPKMAETSPSQGTAGSTTSGNDLFAGAAVEAGDIPGGGVVSDVVKGPLHVLQNATAGNLCSTDDSVDNSQQPIAVDLSREHDLSHCAPFESSVLDTGRKDATLADHVAFPITSSELDVDIKDTEPVMTSSLLDCHATEIEEVNTSGVLDIDVNHNQGVSDIKKDFEHESLSTEAASEPSGTTVVVGKVTGEALGSASVEVTTKMTRDGLQVPSDSSVEVYPSTEITSFVGSSAFLDAGSGEVDGSAEMTNSHDKRTEEDNKSFYVLKVPEDFPLTKNLEMLQEFKDHEPRKKFISASLDASQAIEFVGLASGEEDATRGSQSATQYTEPCESTSSPIHGSFDAVLPLDYTKGADQYRNVVEGLPVGGSSLRSKTKEDEISTKSKTMPDQGSSCSLAVKHIELRESSLHDAVPPGAELIRSGEGIEVDNSEAARGTYIGIGSSSSEVSGGELPATITLCSKSSDNTESQFSHIISLVADSDAHGSEQAGVDDVDSNRQEMESGEEDADADAGTPLEPALPSSLSHDETGMGLEIETSTGYNSVKKPLSLLEGSDCAHEYENTSAGNLDSHQKKAKGEEEEDSSAINAQRLSEHVVAIIPESSGEADGIIDIETSKVQISTGRLSNYATLSNVLESPSHPKDLVGAQDATEDKCSSNDKVVGQETISPIVKSNVLNGVDTVVPDMGSISNNAAVLNLTPETVVIHGENVLGAAVDNIQRSAAEGSCKEESAHDTSGILDESLGAGGDTTSLHQAAVSATTALEAPVLTDIEAIPSNNTVTSARKEMGNLKPESVADCQQSDKSNAVEPPSVMTPVEPEHEDSQSKDAAEAQASENLQRDGSPSPEAGSFPSIGHVSNEPPVMKMNQEIIAKASNWSSSASKKPRVALKSLLGEDEDEKAEPASLKNSASPGTKSGSPRSEGDLNIGSKQQRLDDAGKEWNSTARYPTKVKVEKDKARSRWAPFICCSSMHSTL